MVYRCERHSIAVTTSGAEEQNRNIQTPQGSYMTGVPRCYLLLAVHIQPGQHGECLIIQEPEP